MLRFPKKRDQKKQIVNLQTVTDIEMDGMHSCLRTIVKQSGGLLKIANDQFKLHKYIRSSVVQKQRMLEEE
jgi:hypothetical protein